MSKFPWFSRKKPAVETAAQAADAGLDFSLSEDYPVQGLTETEVTERRARGATNAGAGPETRSYGQIVRDNTLTFFNFLNLGLAAAVAVFALRDPSLWPNIAFMGVVLWNSGLGIFQESRAKRAVDRLTILTQPHIEVIRDGLKRQIEVEELVLDDLFLLKRGDEVSVDGLVMETRGLEADESLLTGESRPVTKRAGDRLLSGSAILSGECRARVMQVGKNTFAKQISNEAKKESRTDSQLVLELDRLVKGVAKVIIPIGVLLILKGAVLEGGLTLPELVVSTVSNLVSMIPEGLILLTTIALAVSVLKLAARHTMAQTLAGIESLARVDTLCLDKTGTITTGEIDILELIPLQEDGGASGSRVNTTGEASARKDISPVNEEARRCLFLLSQVFPAEGISATQDALNRVYGGGDFEILHAVQVRPFSSARKWSGASFEGIGSLVVGAPEFVFRGQELRPSLQQQVEEHTGQGHRVLVLAVSPHLFPETDTHSAQGPALPDGLEPMALVLMGDQIRPDAPETIRYFYSQDVDLKVISGDHPMTVASVAARSGILNTDRLIDMSEIPEDGDYSELAAKYTIFGRVSPFQKRRLLHALQAGGHQVAMTGDGVNDVLALKAANCSVAMAAGSDAARAVADIVLLDNNLASLVQAVFEGRRVINNIQRVATLFLVKTFYASAMALLGIILPVVYPLYPVQGTLINSATVGIPSFFLALKPNRERVTGSFLSNVLPMVIPPGLSVVLGWLAIQIYGGLRNWDYETLSTISLLVVGAVGIATLLRVSRPYDKGRLILAVVCIIGFVAALLFLPGLFQIRPLFDWSILIPGAIFAGSALAFYLLVMAWVERLVSTGRWIRILNRVIKLGRKN